MGGLVAVILFVALFTVMFAMGLNLTLEDFRRVTRHPWAVTIGAGCQLVMLPLLAYALAPAPHPPPALGVGLMVVALCPGGITSNMFSLLARGDVPLSITLTAVISLVTPFTLPLALSWLLRSMLPADQAIPLPLAQTIGLLVALTIIPVGSGMLLRPRFPDLVEASQRALRRLSTLVVVGLTTLAVYQSWDRIGELVAKLGPAILALNLGAIAASVLLARALGVPRYQAATIGIEVGIQNDTIALFMTGSVLQSATMFLAPAAYSIVSMTTGCLFVLLIAPWLRGGARFGEAHAKDYIAV